MDGGLVPVGAFKYVAAVSELQGSQTNWVLALNVDEGVLDSSSLCFSRDSEIDGSQKQPGSRLL